jgi:hypothetical protein
LKIIFFLNIQKRATDGEKLEKERSQIVANKMKE